MKLLIVAALFGVAAAKLPFPTKLGKEFVHLVSQEQIRGGVAAAPASCDDTIFRSCWTKFMTALNINLDLPTDWTNPQELINQLDHILYAQRASGLLLTCRSFVAFHQCMGAMESYCLNAGHIIGHGVTAEDAYWWLGTISYLHFQCGAGLPVVLNNLDCIATASNTQEVDVGDCIANFTGAISSDPFGTCTHGVEFLQCVYNVFVNVCNPATAWFECEGVRVGMVQALFYCPFRCNIDGPGSAMMGQASNQAQLGPAQTIPERHRETFSAFSKTKKLGEA